MLPVIHVQNFLLEIYRGIELLKHRVCEYSIWKIVVNYFLKWLHQFRLYALPLPHTPSTYKRLSESASSLILDIFQLIFAQSSRFKNISRVNLAFSWSLVMLIISLHCHCFFVCLCFFKVASTPSMEPNRGLELTTLDRELRWDQESDT